MPDILPAIFFGASTAARRCWPQCRTGSHDQIFPLIRRRVDARHTSHLPPGWREIRHLDVDRTDMRSETKMHWHRVLGAVAAPRVDDSRTEERAGAGHIQTHFGTLLGVAPFLVEHEDLE